MELLADDDLSGDSSRAASHLRPGVCSSILNSLLPKVTLDEIHELGVSSSWAAVDVYALDPGQSIRPLTSEDFAYLIMDGLAMRESSADALKIVEVLGPGDIVGHFSILDRSAERVPHITRWTTLTNAVIAIIGRHQIYDLARHPQYLHQLFERLDESAEHLRFRISLTSVSRLADRLHLLLWHYAERWGIRRGGQTYVDLPVRQETLAQLVGASRSSVSLALKELAHDRRAVLLRKGRWSLFDSTHTMPPTEKT